MQAGQLKFSLVTIVPSVMPLCYEDTGFFVKINPFSPRFSQIPYMDLFFSIVNLLSFPLCH